jgi:hypothetical protein|tara:strand:+ start:60 stop:722 length:663 start_codon:yes stop_codon:yes gene_type:complete
MKKILIGTPSYDGRVDVWYTDSLVNSTKLAIENNIDLFAIYTSYDALVQRARNKLVQIALEYNFDEIIFIDSDMGWDPQWILDLANRKEDIIGGIAPGRRDIESWNTYIASKNLIYSDDKKLIQVEKIGTGFLKVSKKALLDIWNISSKYLDDEDQKTYCHAFELEVKDNTLFSEDYVFCRKLIDLGYKLWVDPTMNCNHTGTKTFTGNFIEFLNKNGYR